jgi:hypothetical protein
MIDHCRAEMETVARWRRVAAIPVICSGEYRQTVGKPFNGLSKPDPNFCFLTRFDEDRQKPDVMRYLRSMYYLMIDSTPPIRSRHLMIV